MLELPINKLLKKKEFKSSDYYLIITLFYFIIKFTRVSEFGIDLPAIIFSILRRGFDGRFVL